MQIDPEKDDHCCGQLDKKEIEQPFGALCPQQSDLTDQQVEHNLVTDTQERFNASIAPRTAGEE